MEKLSSTKFFEPDQIMTKTLSREIDCRRGLVDAQPPRRTPEL